MEEIIAAFEHAQDEIETKTKALEKLTNDHQKLQNRVSDLNREARNLRRRVCRVERDHEASTAAGATNRSGSNAWRILINLPQQQIDDWVYDLACKLIFVHRLPEEEGPGAICDILQAMAAVGTDPSANPNEGPDVEKASVAGEFDAATG